MSLSRRVDFAMAALTGLLSVPVPKDSGYDLGYLVNQAFLLADDCVAHSAPDAIEALEELVKAVDVPRSQFVRDDILDAIVVRAETARAVLARYEKEPE